MKIAVAVEFFIESIYIPGFRQCLDFQSNVECGINQSFILEINRSE